MILVTLGTQDKPFTRLLQAIEKYVIKNKIKEEIIVFAGFTTFESKHMKVINAPTRKEYEDAFKKARILITHGGVSSIFDGLKNNLPVIATPRLGKYNEHINDHQKQIIAEFSRQGYVIALNNLNKLSDAIKEAKTFKPKKYVSTTKNITNYIADFIKNN